MRIEPLPPLLLQADMFCEAGRALPSESVLKQLRECDNCLKLSASGGSVCVLDAAVVQEQIDTWRRIMHPIRPHYAVKALPQPVVCNLFDRFDCASLAEIEMVLALGKDPANIIFANTTKRPSDLLQAARLGVATVTADNAAECAKVLELHPSCGIVLRLCVDDTGAQHTRFSNKYGIAGFEAACLLVDLLAPSHSLRGFSFHVGSGQLTSDAWHRAMIQVDKLLDYARITYPDLYDSVSVIDIGGGFAPGKQVVALEEVRCSLEPWISKYADKCWVAEPGRWFVSEAVSLLCSVLGRAWRGDSLQYVLANGLYHTFSCIVFDNRRPRKMSSEDWRALPEAAPLKCVQGTVVGETCDGADVVYSGLVPVDLPLGTLIYFPGLGAYANASASHFNGFAPPGVIFLKGAEATPP